MYYCVSRLVDSGRTIYTDDIVSADNQESIENYYSSKYPNSEIMIFEAFDWEVEAAKEKGMAIVIIK